MKFVIKEIELKNGETAIAFVEFNEGNSHIIVDGGCWVIINGKGMSPWIFTEAAIALRSLPCNPHEYEPYRVAVGADSKHTQLKSAVQDLLKDLRIDRGDLLDRSCGEEFEENHLGESVENKIKQGTAKKLLDAGICSE